MPRLDRHRSSALIAVAAAGLLAGCAVAERGDRATSETSTATSSEIAADHSSDDHSRRGHSGHDHSSHDGTAHDGSTVPTAHDETLAHGPAMALIDPTAATDVAATSGPWSSPATWASGAPPQDGSRVHIPAGVTVTVDGVLEPEMKTIGVDGELQFATDVDTELRVDTLVTTPSGTLRIGAPDRPIDGDVIASVVFTDDGPIDREWDPTLVSRGALLHGTTIVQGADVTHRSVVATYPRAGDTAIELRDDLNGWRVGDEIVVTGTNGPTSDERRTVADVDGRTITLDRALELDHVPPADDLDLYVAHLTRNVQFTSENPDVQRRGHLMVMHTLDAKIRGARFTDMGRTDKRRELDDVQFIDMEPGAVGWEGEFETLGGDNVRGRYSVHIHRGGADPTSTAAVVADSVVTGDPGWAFTNHSSHVDFLRNVAYDNAGAGFFTEAGDETGRWIDNIAIRTVMPGFTFGDGDAIDPDVRADRQDFGIDGDGFWLQGNRMDVIGNVSAGSTAHGIIWWSEALAEADIEQVASVDVATLPDPTLVPDRERLSVWWAPLGEVRDNVAYGSTIGFRARYIHGGTYLDDPDPPPAAYIDALDPVIDGLTTWDVRDGVLMNYNERLTLRDVRAIGVAEPFRHNYGHTAAVGVGLDVGNDATFGPGTIEDVELSGFEVGLIGPRHGAWTIDDVSIAATTDVLLHSPEHTERSLEITDPTFAPLDGTSLRGREAERRHVVLAYDYAGDGDGVDPTMRSSASESDPRALLADRVTLDGRGLYSLGQLPGAVPIAEGPDAGLTNRELQQRRGTSAGGTLPPVDATTSDLVANGLVGSPASMPTLTHAPGSGGFLEFDDGMDDDEDDDE